MPNAIKWGDEFHISNPFRDDEGQPALAGLADGRFVAAWTGIDDGGYSTEVRTYNTDGSPGGGAYSVDEGPTLAPDPSVVALAGGGYAFARTLSRGANSAVVTQAFEADTSLAGAEFWSGNPLEDRHHLSGLAANAGGGFVAAWHVKDDATETTVQLFGADGSPGNAITFLSEAREYSDPPGITTLDGGKHVVVWTDSDQEILASIVSANATAVTDPFKVNTTASGIQGAPVVTRLANGGFVVVWHSRQNDGASIRGQLFDADGERVGAEFKINTATSAIQLDPEIALLVDGRFAVAWTDMSNPDPNAIVSNVHVQLFDPDGARSGDELVVNPPSLPGYHFDPAITALADGRFVVAWQHELDIENPAGAGLHGQIFDTRQGPVNLVGTPLANNLAGTVFNDTLTGAAGDDYLAGGAGDDTATFSQAREQYTVTEFADRIVVAGPDGTDTLTGIEHLRFAVAEPGPQPTPPGPEPAPPGPPDYISGLFDTVYYLTRYADVSAAGVSARDHYNDFGWQEGRAPNAFFDTVGYLGANPGVRDAGFNPLLHYHQIGWLDGRDPSAVFDTKLYLLHNPDVAGVDPLEHYLQHGLSEGRAIYQATGEDIVGGFDAEWYMLHNPDVAAAGVEARMHFDGFGWHEGRNPNGWFDTAGYLARYADVAAAGVNPLDHYVTFGWREGRDASAGFDTLGYLAANPDVAAANVNPLEHFLTFGIYEGRSAVNDGIWH